MESMFPIIATASKLASVPAVGTVIVVMGAIVAVGSWVWLIYQNFRFSPIHGVLSIIPLWALIYGFVRMEHAQKEPWISAFVCGIVIAAVGWILLVAAQVCDESDACMRRGEQQETEQQVESDPTSSLMPSTIFDQMSS